MLAGKRLLLVISGGIAAYKSLELIRRLRERGVERAHDPHQGRGAIRDPAVGRGPQREQGLSGALLPHRRERDGPYPPVAGIRSDRGGPGQRRPPGQAGPWAGRRSCLHDPAGGRQAGADRALDEHPDVGPSRDPGQYRHPQIPRRSPDRARGGRSRLRRVRQRADGRADGDPGRHRGLFRRRCAPERPARFGHQRPHLRGHRSRALHRQPLLRQAGPCHRRRARPAGRGDRPGLRPDGRAGPGRGRGAPYRERRGDAGRLPRGAARRYRRLRGGGRRLAPGQASRPRR